MARKNLIKYQHDGILREKQPEEPCMVRWKLRNRSKSTEDTTGQIDTVHMEMKQVQPTDTTQAEQPEPEEVPVKEYNEVLCSRTTPLKKLSIPTEPKKEPVHRTGWENPSTIERNVDMIGHKKTETMGSHLQTSDEIEKKVDRLIAKKKLKR